MLNKQRVWFLACRSLAAPAASRSEIEYVSTDSVMAARRESHLADPRVALKRPRFDSGEWHKYQERQPRKAIIVHGQYRCHFGLT